MGSVFTAAIAIYIVTFFLAIYIFYVADTKTSNIAKLVTSVIPDHIITIIEKTCGTESKAFVIRTHNYLTKERNPALLIFYLIILLGSWNVMITHGYPHIPSRYVGGYHRFIGYLLFVICMMVFRLTAWTSPGNVTQDTMTKHDNYLYDNVLYVQGETCPTLGIRAIARSKYDETVKRRIPRYDHYCGWLDQAIGEENYRLYLLFLFLQFFMCWYGFIVIILIFKGEIVDMKLFERTFTNTVTGESSPATWNLVIQYIIDQHLHLFGLLLFLLLVAIVLTIFLSFHLYLVGENKTTYEFYKWHSVKKWHHEATKKYKESLHAKPNKEHSSAGDNKSQEGVQTPHPPLNGNAGKKGTETPLEGLNNKPTADDKKEPIDTNGHKEITNNPGPMPKNMYNLGFSENIREVFYPRSMKPFTLARYSLELMERKETMTRNEKKRK